MVSSATGKCRASPLCALEPRPQLCSVPVPLPARPGHAIESSSPTHTETRRRRAAILRAARPGLRGCGGHAVHRFSAYGQPARPDVFPQRAHSSCPVFRTQREKVPSGGQARTCRAPRASQLAHLAAAHPAVPAVPALVQVVRARARPRAVGQRRALSACCCSRSTRPLRVRRRTRSLLCAPSERTAPSDFTKARPSATTRA